MEIWQRAGAARPVDVAQGQAQLAATRSTLIQARNDVGNGRAMLALADHRRQDMVAARLQVKAAGESLDAAWGEYFPS